MHTNPRANMETHWPGHLKRDTRPTHFEREAGQYGPSVSRPIRSEMRRPRFAGTLGACQCTLSAGRFERGYLLNGLMTKDYSLTAIIIEQAHTILGHFGAQKTADYICRWYWWPRLGVEVNKYCISCGICQANKTNTQRPVGLLHPLPIPNRPWGLIGMDFIGPFPKSKGYDYLCAVICRLTSMVPL